MYLKLCQNLPTIYLWLKILKFTSKPIISTWIPNHTTSNSFPNVSVPYWFSLPKLSSTAGKLTFSFGCFLYFFFSLAIIFIFLLISLCISVLLFFALFALFLTQEDFSSLSEDQTWMDSRGYNFDSPHTWGVENLWSCK